MGSCKALQEVDVISVWAFFVLLGDLEQESAKGFRCEASEALSPGSPMSPASALCARTDLRR